MAAEIIESDTYEIDGQTFDVLPQDAGPADVVFPGYRAVRNFSFDGVRFRVGDEITLAVRQHRRFENLLATNQIKAV